MNKLISILLSSILFTGCGSEVVQVLEGPQGPKGDPGTSVEIPVSDDFVGEYYLPYAGFVIITKNHENKYSTDVNIQLLNPNNTICNLDVDGALLDVHGDKIVYTGSISLSSGNCRSDADVALLTSGSVTYQYELSISFDDSDLLTLRLLVFQTASGIRSLVINRTISEE